MRDRVIRIDRDGLVITNDGLCKTLFVELVPERAATQIRFVRLWVVRAALCESSQFITRQMRHDGLSDVGRNRVLQPQHVREIFVKLSGPGGRPILHVQQLNGYANAIAGLTNAPFKYES